MRWACVSEEDELGDRIQVEFERYMGWPTPNNIQSREKAEEKKYLLQSQFLNLNKYMYIFFNLKIISVSYS